MILALLVTGTSTAAEQVAQVDGRRPNIVLVMADDLGWSDIGCYGGEIGTPNIDSLATDGLRFRQFYNNAICGPTRASLLTGLYPQQIGHRGDRWNEPKDFRRCVTFGEILQQAGYHTMMVGKWQGRDSALDRGFDRFYGPMCQAKISYFDEVVQNPFYLDRERIQLPDDFYLTDAFNEYAAKFLNEAISRDEPFLLYVGHIAPHWPLHARESEVARFRARYQSTGWDEVRLARFRRQQQDGLIPGDWKMSPRPASIPSWSDEKLPDWQAERMAVYAAQVAAIDRGMGQLLEILKQSQNARNTLVMFLSDNGAAPDGGLTPSRGGFGFTPDRPNTNWRLDGQPIRPGSGPEHPPGAHDTFAAYGLAWATASNTPLRGTKLGAYEGGIRTPLVVRWPAVISDSGGLTDVPGHVMDLMPTFLELAGTDYPSELNGRRPLPLEGESLVPILQGKQRQRPVELCWIVPRHEVIRSGDWKAVRPRSGGTWQLFNLRIDGTETTDLAQQHPEQVERLARQFAAWKTRTGAR